MPPAPHLGRPETLSPLSLNGSLGGCDQPLQPGPHATRHPPLTPQHRTPRAAGGDASQAVSQACSVLTPRGRTMVSGLPLSCPSLLWGARPCPQPPPPQQEAHPAVPTSLFLGPKAIRSCRKGQGGAERQKRGSRPCESTPTDQLSPPRHSLGLRPCPCMNTPPPWEVRPHGTGPALRSLVHASSKKHDHYPLPILSLRKAARSTFFEFRFFSWGPQDRERNPSIQSPLL